MKIKKQTLEDQIISRIPYILSHLDRDQYSSTAGSFDRLYWGWKLKDYSDATLQRLAYPLTNYYQKVDNDLYDEEKFLSWIIKSFNFIKSIQHTDGSFDQAFPHEHSHGATAFLLYDSACSFDLIQDKLDTAKRDEILRTIKKMADYLVVFDEEHGFISNHLAGAAAGLEKLFSITREEKYRIRARYYIDRILSRQSSEGWYWEYGGADPGYHTLAIYYLAHYYEGTREPEVLDSLKTACEFASYFVHPDGSFGGEYGSRNTEVFYPGGFAILHKEVPLAAAILNVMIGSIESGTTVNLDSIDLGNLAPLMNNYLDLAAYIPIKSNKMIESIPFQRSEFVKEFQDAGLVIHNGKKHYAVVGLSKGGVVKEYDKEKKTQVLDDCGYIGKLQNGKMISTQNHNNHKIHYTPEFAEVQVPFYEISQNVPDPFKFLALRIFNVTVGRIRPVREMVKKLLVKVLLSNAGKSRFTLIRRIVFSDPVKIVDSIEPQPDGGSFAFLDHGIKFSTIHMASSKYYYHK